MCHCETWKMPGLAMMILLREGDYPMRLSFRWLSLMALLFLITSSFSVSTAISSPQPAQPGPWQTKVDPWVLETATQGETEFIVFLAEQADLSGAASLKTKLEKGIYVYQRLTEVAARTQPPVLAALESLGVEHRPYWVANMIWVRASMDAVRSVAQRADVAHLYANPTVHFEEPSVQTGPIQPDTIEWNITKVGAPSVWAAGYTGQGAVVAGQDTGYDWDHPALINKYRGWSGSVANHNYNWHDAIHSGGGVCGANSPQPCDDYGHGTPTMGTLVGDDGAGYQIERLDDLIPDAANESQELRERFRHFPYLMLLALRKPR
jgi:subtilisin family serine protease